MSHSRKVHVGLRLVRSMFTLTTAFTFTTRFGSFRTPGNRLRSRTCLLGLLALVLFWTFIGGSAAAHTGVPAVSVTSFAPAFPIAIADFDGDLRPDLASVSTGESGALRTHYSIHLQSTAAGRQSIQLVGPTGGLQIAARDVNGDHAVDLVVTDAWRQQPVAIFLNDGHGTFTRAATAAFRDVFSESHAAFSSGSFRGTDAAAVPPPLESGAMLQARKFCYCAARISFLSPSNSCLLIHSLPLRHLGRAPPCKNSQL